MSKSEDLQLAGLNSRLRWITAISIFEAVLTLIILFSIPPDPKNAMLFGYSWKRWLIFLSTFLICAYLVFQFLKPNNIQNRLRNIQAAGKVPQWIEITGILSVLLLWVLFWLPPERLGEMADDYTRLQPLIILFFLLWAQFYVFVQISLNPGKLQSEIHRIAGFRKQILIVLSILILIILIFALLNKAHLTMSSNSFYFPPSSILSALQVFSIWLLFFGLQLISGKLFLKSKTDKKWVILIAALVWLSAFLIWNATPLECSNDRPGPDMPNMQCYPPIDDAVYSIGSHYIRLGEGVHNQWSTDKPLLLIILALGQFIFGPNIDQYLTFQIILIALIPALLFIIGYRFTGIAGGVFIAGLATLKGVNEIALYRSVGGMNVKIENTENLMGLILILLAISLFRWTTTPENYRWAMLTGGLLGLGILVRFNPIGILPLILLVLISVNRKQLRKIFITLILFGAALMVTTMPWFLTARDTQGNSYYLIKIQDVLNSRYLEPQATDVDLPVPPQAVPAEPLVIEESQTQTLPMDEPQVIETTSNRVENILLHFFNNELSAIAELPINYSFDKRTTITGQTLWDMQTLKPIWLAGLSFENQLMLVVNLFLVLIGIMIAFYRWRISGLVPLIIQTGYFLGNAAAMTSGERYLQPVNWVILIYYCLGIVAISNLVFHFLLPKKWGVLFRKSITTSAAVSERASKNKMREIIITLGILLVIGLIPYGVNFLPEKLPVESSVNTSAVAFNSISEQTAITETQWQTFLNSSAAIVVEGKAYHPRIYQSNTYFTGEQVFEIMLLGKDFVYVSHILNVAPEMYFSDDSDVILAGCILRSDEVWGSKRKIMQTFAVIQMDHEQQIYIDPKASWFCENQ